MVLCFEIVVKIVQFIQAYWYYHWNLWSQYSVYCAYESDQLDKIGQISGMMEQSTRVELDGKMLEIINAVEDQNTRDVIRELAVIFKEKSELDEKRFAKVGMLT